MDIKESIESVRRQFRSDSDPFPSDKDSLENLKIKFLGRKGLIANLFSQIPNLSNDQKPIAGKLLNQLKIELENSFPSKTESASHLEEIIDRSLPGVIYPPGNKHPIQSTMDEIKRLFGQIGFAVAYGPEIDDDFHNFSALNFPKDHPARDMQDTFFTKEDLILRTHTSNVQVHLMEEKQPPLRYIVPGRVYRNESISFKSFCLFHQVEGIYIDKNVTFSDLKGTLEYFVKKMFGSKTKMRFRPSFFPFTEPSAEVDIWSEKNKQWLEILGSGMVDPEVFKAVNVDNNLWNGFAFGMGVERICMLQYEIDDIRLLYQNDVRFLEQF
jgi:phenylalanyl-tRNA synthetase alpha chain|tara:strand:+ start:153 stop:1130 length:978 start_codon:yes stop_codon:yes gene_type:complete